MPTFLASLPHPLAVHLAEAAVLPEVIRGDLVARMSTFLANLPHPLVAFHEGEGGLLVVSLGDPWE